MAVKLNRTGYSHARKLIEQGKVDRNSSWSFSADDENRILGANENWDEYKKWFLAIDTDEPADTKKHYKFPYGKNGKVYRRGVIAAKQRASQFGYTDIMEAADRLLKMIDKDESKKEALEIDVVEKEVTFLVEPEARFISLVSRGANRVPFKIIKCDSDKEKPMRVVQTIIAPADKSPEQLMQLFGDELAGVVKLDSGKGTSVKSYEQLPRDMFVEDSLELVKLSDDVMAVCGTLKEDDRNGLISKIFSKKKKPKEVVEIDESVQKLDDEETIRVASEMANELIHKLNQEILKAFADPEITNRIDYVAEVFMDAIAEFDAIVRIARNQPLMLTSSEKDALSDDDDVDVNKPESATETSENATDQKCDSESQPEDVEKSEQKDNDTDGLEAFTTKIDEIFNRIASLEEALKKAEQEKFGELESKINQIVEKVEKLETSIPVRVRMDSEPVPEKTKKNESIFAGVLFRE